MNWGYRILTVYLLFVGGIVTLAVLSFQQTLDLETEDYYEAEKLQDSKMEQRKLGQTYKHLIKINQGTDSLVFVLPPDITEKPKLEGELRLIRPSDKKLDRNISFEQLQNGSIGVQKSDLAMGHWKYALEWQHAFGHFLIEDTLVIL